MIKICSNCDYVYLNFENKYFICPSCGQVTKECEEDFGANKLLSDYKVDKSRFENTAYSGIITQLYTFFAHSVLVAIYNMYVYYNRNLFIGPEPHRRNILVLNLVYSMIFVAICNETDKYFDKKLRFIVHHLFEKNYVKMYIKIGTVLSNLVIIAGLFGSFLIFKNTVYNLKIIDAGQIALYQKVVRGLIVSGVVYFLLMLFALSIFSSNYIKKLPI